MAPDTPPVTVTLARVYEGIVEVKALVNSMDSRLRILDSTVSRLESTVCKLDTTVRGLDKEVAVIKDWRASQVNHAIREVSDLKVQLAKIAAGGGGFALITAALVAILKAAGVL